MKIDAHRIIERAQEFRTILQEINLQEEVERDINIINNTLTNHIVKAGTKVAIKRRKNKVSNETKHLMSQRRELISQGKRQANEYKLLNKTIHIRIKDLKKYNEAKLDKIITTNRGMKCPRPTLGKTRIFAMKDRN